jgi:hypothetical protein
VIVPSLSWQTNVSCFRIEIGRFETNVVLFSRFLFFSLLQALANLGHWEHAIAAVNHCWEPMTRLAHGCFLELFDPDWADVMHIGQKAPSRYVLRIA